jgi:hypothetical protein
MEGTRGEVNAIALTSPGQQTPTQRHYEVFKQDEHEANDSELCVGFQSLIIIPGSNCVKYRMHNTHKHHIKYV